MTSPACPTRAARRGAVLLEVVLALALFVAVATIIATALSSSSDAVQRQKLNLHAANLAASVLAELQMGARPAETAGPENFAAPFEDWTWELALAQVEDEAGQYSGVTRAEVIIRHDDPPVVHRLAQLINTPEKSNGTASRNAAGSF